MPRSEQQKRSDVAKMEAELTQPPSQDSLDLVPSSEEGRRDLGLSSQDIQATSKVLAGLLKSSESDPMTPVMIGNLKPVLEEQLWHALQREKAEQNLAEKAGVKNEERRKIVVGTLRAVGLSSMTLGVLGTLYRLVEGLLSPETQAAIAEEERKRKEELERNNTLGLIPSAPSYAGWRIKYLPVDDRYPLN